MHSPSARLASDDGRPAPEPRLVPGSPADQLARVIAAERAPAHAMIALGLAGAGAFLNVYVTQPLLPLLSATLGVSKAAAALTVSAPAIAVALAAPFAGGLADRLGRRRVIVAALFALAVPTALAATSGGIAALVAWRFAQGIAVAGVYAVGLAYAGTAWKGGDVGRAAAALVTGNVLGAFLGRTVSGVMAEHGGWRVAFLALGLLTLAGAELTRRWLPPDGAAPAPSLPARPLQAARALAGALRDPRLAATFAAGFAMLFAQVAMFTYVTFHLSAPPFRLGAAALGSIFLVYLAGAAVTPVAGAWIGRLGARRIYALALAGSLAGCALALVPSVPVVVAGLGLCATATFVGQAAAASHLTAVAPPALRSVAFGAYLSCYYLGGAVGGLVPALAWDAGGWRACVALVAAVDLATLAAAWRFWEREPARRAVGVAVTV